MSILIFNLPTGMPASTSTLSVGQVNSANAPAQLQEVPLGLLPLVPGAELVALVPAQHLSWHAVELPAGTLGKGIFQDGGSPRLRSVLDGLLEERLLDDTAALHFAVAPNARTGAATWIASCDSAWLRAWLDALEQVGRNITRVVPEFAPPDDPEAPLQIHVMGAPTEAYVVCCGPTGIVTLPFHATTLHSVLQPPFTADTTQWSAEPGVAHLAEQLTQSPIALRTDAERARLAVQSAWDLAQFEFSASRQARSRKRWSSLWAALLHAPQWRMARWATVALVAVQVMGLQIWSWKEQTAQADKRKAIATVLTSTFAQIPLVVDAPVQMARAVADLQRQSGVASGADLEAVLSHFGALAGVFIAPTAIEFIANETRISGLNQQAPEIATLTASLQSQGYQARWDGTTYVIAQARNGATP
jgi:general secretion pathway protein L